MTDREKLIELVHEALEKCNTTLCSECEYIELNNGCCDLCFEHLAADYLISKGVTIPVRCGECIHLQRIFAVTEKGKKKMSESIKPDYEALYLEEKDKYNKVLNRHYELERHARELEQENKILSAQVDIVRLIFRGRGDQ